MPRHSPAAQVARSAPRSLVLLRPTGWLVRALLVLGVLLLLNRWKLARGLLWGSVGALAAALGLLGLGYSAGLVLLPPAVVYAAFYYLRQADADLTP